MLFMTVHSSMSIEVSIIWRLTSYLQKGFPSDRSTDSTPSVFSERWQLAKQFKTIAMSSSDKKKWKQKATRRNYRRGRLRDDRKSMAKIEIKSAKNNAEKSAKSRTDRCKPY